MMVMKPEIPPIDQVDRREVVKFGAGYSETRTEFMLMVLVSEDGSVTNAQVYEPTSFPSFDQAALASVRQWKYPPATLEGQAIKVPYCIEIQFAIAQRSYQHQVKQILCGSAV